MDQNPGGIRAVIGISAKVIAPVHDHAFPSCGGESFRDDETGKTGANDQEIGGCVGWQKLEWDEGGSITLPPLVDPSEREGNLGDGNWGIEGGRHHCGDYPHKRRRRVFNENRTF
jgi:hypothetical protein